MDCKTTPAIHIANDDDQFNMGAMIENTRRIFAISGKKLIFIGWENSFATSSLNTNVLRR